MAYLLPALILLFCAPAVFVRDSMVGGIYWLAGISLALGACGRLWPILMPANFLVDHPTLADSPLHPEISLLLGGVALLFGVGLLLALGCRYLLHYTGMLKKVPEERS